ncbi:branched-chain amino acid ABC transporter permease [Rhodoferax sp.]|uniref:branched-chain amino acid ABC transporter permease n=1 Tax=Rhodoferax sp. TaxID=50421 RepID=UPI001EC6A1AC|nr:branched-chain amino acid ABC transporter permease [Rhodoferax sp.]MBT9508181.1 branched-chain amino acid ABC transporter permease [Rhodoferax sp.]
MSLRKLSSSATVPALLLAGAVFAAGAWVMPAWLAFLLTLALSKALVVLGVVIQMRAGLVSFGQALFYCIGGYGVGLASQYLGVNDAFALLAVGTVSAILLALACGWLLTRYREIFYAMLTLALSMILYGVLVKSSALGSTDGFNVAPPSFLGWVPQGDARKQALYLLAVLVATVAALGFHRFMVSSLGRVTEAVRENEIRVEYLGLSPQRVLFVNYVVAAGVSALGGGLTALASGHIDPDMAFWTTSGEFVFIAILGGTGHVAAPFIGAIVFSVIRTFAIQEAPNTWQMTLGFILLALILFLPKGLWSLVARDKKPGVAV